MVENNNPKDLVQGDHAVVHPDWLLAAWSVDQNGILSEDRPAAGALVRNLRRYIASSSGEDMAAFELFANSFVIGFFSTLQAMSMVDYQFSPVASSSAAVVDHDPAHPVFRRYATIHVWAFGNTSRSSQLGMVVVIAGIVCVLLRTVLLFMMPTRQRSTTELVVAALEHQSQGEFAGISASDETALAKVRYELGDDEHNNFKYWPVSRYVNTGTAAGTP
ncbi:hypothetical protein MMC16_005101 [Acarospora aff. strigata]|nr:hypothetical protein [Acarospora aff. strigata]